MAFIFNMYMYISCDDAFPFIPKVLTFLQDFNDFTPNNLTPKAGDHISLNLLVFSLFVGCFYHKGPALSTNHLFLPTNSYTSITFGIHIWYHL